jgi:hypothetical protein
LIEDDSDCPDIAADAVYIFLEGLGRHVDWRSHVVIFVIGNLAYRYREAKIAVFVYSILVEDVGRFNVSVQKASPVDIAIAYD